MMKRNKRTEVMGHDDLTPLTEQILAQMGPKGSEIRQRLKKFYRQKAGRNLTLVAKQGRQLKVLA
jgi:hypothetical protein